jgi:hypothetical protein
MLASFVFQILLVIAAFRTSKRLGILAFFVPMFVTSFGNYRLKTPHRRQLAAGWWLSLVGLIASVAIYPR